jgi:hypothetical protein
MKCSFIKKKRYLNYKGYLMFAKSLALAALCGMSFAASAVTVDLRHEFIDGGEVGQEQR